MALLDQIVDFLNSKLFGSSILYAACWRHSFLGSGCLSCCCTSCALSSMCKSVVTALTPPSTIVSFVKLPSVTSFGSSAPTALFYYFSIYWLRGLASQLYTQGTWGMRKRPPPVVPWFGVKRQLRQQHAFFYLPLLALRYSTFQFHVQRPGHRGRDPQLLSLRWLVTWTWERVVNWRRPRPNFDVWLRC